MNSNQTVKPSDVIGWLESVLKEIYNLHNECMKPLAKVLENIVKERDDVEVTIEFDPRKPDNRKGSYYAQERKIVLYTINNNFFDLFKTLSHEVRHAIQHKTLGDKYSEEYRKAESIFGYWDNPFQIDARNYEERWFGIYRRLIVNIGNKNYLDLFNAYECISYLLNKAKSYFDIVELIVSRYYSEPIPNSIIEYARSKADDLRSIKSEMEKCCKRLSESLKGAV